MKHTLILLFSIITVFGTSQIVTESKSSDEVKTQKTSSGESTTELYFGASPSYTYRTLTVNEGLFAQPLGEREQEVAEWTTGFNAGVRTHLSSFLKLEIGVGFSSNKESYDFSSKDSIYVYSNSYRHITFPMRLAYSYGDDISFYGGLGVIPKAFLSMKNELTTYDINGKEQTEKTIEKDKFNFFLIDAVATIGTQIKFNSHYGIYAMIEGRRQLNNNYDAQSAYVRKPYALGFNVGIEVYL